MCVCLSLCARPPLHIFQRDRHIHWGPISHSQAHLIKLLLCLHTNLFSIFDERHEVLEIEHVLSITFHNLHMRSCEFEYAA